MSSSRSVATVGRPTVRHVLHIDRTAQIVIAGLAFLQNLRRGHYELALDTARPLKSVPADASGTDDDLQHAANTTGATRPVGV